ncbi:MAG: AraC family transcriptional regulator [Bacilli bacterium]|jgi:AraC-like DNA-binding protein/uncharacterized protein YjlB
MGVNENFYENKQHGEPDFPIRLYESVYSGFKDCYLHWHKEFEIMHVLKGQADIYIDGVIERAHPGDILFVPKNALHHIKQIMGKDVLAIDAIVFDLDLLGGTERDFVERSLITPIAEAKMAVTQIVHPEDPGYSILIGRIKEIRDMMKEKPSWFQVMVKSELYALVFHLIKFGYLVSREESYIPNTKQLSMIKKAAAYLSEHLEERLTIKKLAEKFGYTEYHFSRLFKKHTGNTINGFINDLSMNRAKHLLTRTGLSLDEIAQEVGYNGASYFIQAFKRFNSGLTPNKYRALMTKSQQ